MRKTKRKVIDMDTNVNRKFCTNCGAPLAQGMKFCNHCGTPVPQQAAPVRNAPQQSAPNNYSYGSQPNYNQASRPAYNQSAQSTYHYSAQQAAPVHAAEPMTKKQYRKTCTNPDYLKKVKSNAILIYVLVGLNVLLAFVTTPLAILDAVINLALALGMHLGKSKGCAVAILVYAILSMAMMLISGSMGGWLWLIAGIGAVKAFSVADKEYESIYGK